MRTWSWLALIWLCCVIRLTFYAAALPLWEGYDEWGHFAVIRATALGGRMLPSRDAPVQRDVEASLELAPIPWELRYLPAPSLTHDSFWALNAADRASRERTFQAMPVAWSREKSTGNLTQYEAQQPPLYYWLMAPAMYLARGWSLSGQVMLLRWISLLIASLAVPFVFLIARDALHEDRAALGCAALLAAMPGFALDVSRVGNECLSVVLFAALLWWGLRRASVGLGILLGLGLLTKAYFLVAALAVLIFFRRRSWPALLVSAAIGGWWYGRNFLNGAVSGMNESIRMQEVAHTTFLEKVIATPWLRAVDTISFSHLYYGGWSSLMVKSWIYHVLYLIAMAGAAGAVLLWRRRDVAWLGLVYVLFWIAQLYFALVVYAADRGALPPGWYLYSVAGAEITLCVAGLYRILPRAAHRWVLPAGVFLFCALDLYTMNAVGIPYYTGMIRHRAGGALGALHLADFQAVGFHEAFLRLSMFKPAAISAGSLMGLWGAYVLSTVGLAVAAALSLRSPD